jgi:hypothetical protein
MTATTVVPQVSDDVLRALSQAEGVCVRPLLNRQTSRSSGLSLGGASSQRRHVNGQFVVPAGGQLKVPTLRG